MHRIQLDAVIKHLRRVEHLIDSLTRLLIKSVLHELLLEAEVLKLLFLFALAPNV